MFSTVIPPEGVQNVEAALRDELAQGDAVLGTIGPILRHLLANSDQSLYSDEVVARIRGVTADIARQMMERICDSEDRGPLVAAPEHLEGLTATLAAMPPLVGHLHALALEWQLTERLQNRLALDPVVSPLLQALIASSDPATATLAMQFLAAQSRFCQAQKRMTHALEELPGDLVHSCLMALRTYAQEIGEDERATAAEAAIRSRYNEGASRLGLIARLVSGMGGGAVAALSVTHAGIAIFASALALASGQDRDLAILSTHDSQLARLALALCASGLKPKAIEEQFLALHPDIALPTGFDSLDADRAAATLAGSCALTGV